MEMEKEAKDAKGEDGQVPDDDAYPDPNEECCNDRKFFSERDQVLRMLQTLVDEKLPTLTSPVSSEYEHRVQHVMWIFDHYLEQPHLLDPHLREILVPIVGEIQRIIFEFAEDRAQQATKGCAFPCQLFFSPKLQKFCLLVYSLCKVRGAKRIVKLLPHEVSVFEPTLLMLQSLDPSDCKTWEMRYVLLLWLSMLCLVPFDLQTIDSKEVDDDEMQFSTETSSTTRASTSLVASLLTICKGCLAESGTTQSAAAICLARLLSRPDVEAHDLHPFLLWANAQLRDAAQPSLPREQQFRVTGVMLCLANLAKFAPRESHIAASRVYFATVMALITSLIEQDSKFEGLTSSMLHRKLSMKLVQRLGLLYLPPRVQSWRYKRGLRSLELTMATGEPTTAGTTAASQDTHNVEIPLTGEDSSAVLDSVEELEQVVEVLLCGLRDKDTVVRWSAAKGIGRITGRLPFEYADDVVQSILELFIATETDAAWHGASLAVAELARRGVLLPHRLTDAVDCVVRALQYDVRRGTHSIGSHVRDAACYACWSFARAYDPELLRPHLEKTLAPAMLINCVFDRELNCRRAASAAFQENVGRQGRTNFPHGIAVLTRADYFSIANIRHAFLDVSVFIAQFAMYRYAMIDHLVSRKLQHWDPALRQLAALAVGRISALDPSFAIHDIIPRLMAIALGEQTEVIARHGAILALAEVLLALLRVPAFIDGPVQAQIKGLPLEVDHRRLFRGRGGDLVRVAVCRLVEVISHTRTTFSFPHVRKYFRLLEECMVHPLDNVRDAAIPAFAAFTAQFVPRMLEKGPPTVRDYLAGRVPSYLHEGVLTTIKEAETEVIVLNPNVAVRRGYIRALGAVAKELLQPALMECFQVLFRAANLAQQTVDERDAVSRVSAIRAIVEICSRVNYEDLDLGGLEVKAIENLVQCVEQDYSVDERGDVGSWVRKEAILGLEALLLNTVPAARRIETEMVGRNVKTQYGPGCIVRVLAEYETLDDPQDASEESAATPDPVCHVRFDKPALGFFYFAPSGVAKLHISSLQVAETDSEDADFIISALKDRQVDALKDHPTMPTRRPFATRIPPAVIASVFCSLAKQLAEKLDNMRAIAGKILFRLLHSTRPRVDGIPGRFQLERDILPPNLSINWSMARDTFPLVVRMMDNPAFLEAIAAGLVISVGGLTESVVKASRQALLKWLRSHTQARDFGLLRRFAFFLVTLLRRHQRDDRVTLPLLTTLAMLLDEGVLGFMFTAEAKEDAAEFGNSLYAALKDEMHQASSIQKIAAGIAVLVGLLPSEPDTQPKTLRALVMFLAHRFPKIRKVTADRLYTRLLLHEEVIESEQYDVVVDILGRTAWDGSLVAARTARNSLLEVLRMEAPMKKRRIEAAEGTEAPPATMECEVAQ